MTTPRPSRSPRLRALAEHCDGFRLAEIDLELRGRGELTGSRQSGAVAHRVARLPEDAALLERAHAHARVDHGRRRRARGRRARAPARRARARTSAPRRSRRSVRLSAWAASALARCLARDARDRRAPRRQAHPRPPWARHAADRGGGTRGALLDARRRRPTHEVLDLFAGSGALGIEALSRGARRAVFVERNAGSFAALAVQPALARARPGRSPSRGAWRRARGSALHAGAGKRTIWSSSIRPTGKRRSGRACSETRFRRCSNEAARVVVESDRRAPLDLELPVEQERRYGDTLITIHRRELTRRAAHTGAPCAPTQRRPQEQALSDIAVCPGLLRSRHQRAPGHHPQDRRALRRSRGRSRQPPDAQGQDAVHHRGTRGLHRRGGARASGACAWSPSRRSWSSSPSASARR